VRLVGYLKRRPKFISIYLYVYILWGFFFAVTRKLNIYRLKCECMCTFSVCQYWYGHSSVWPVLPHTSYDE